MKLSGRLHSGALLSLCLFSVTATGRLGLPRRDETTLSTEGTSTPTTRASAPETTSSPPRSTSVATSTTSAPASSPTRPASSASASSTTTGSLNSTLFNVMLPPNQLPLEPEITPGWAVAGAILLGTGVVFALVGIKTKYLHSFFSTAFLASLGTTVLIIYVMTPPVSHAIQGAYVVAVVCTGMILGALAVVFKEIMECLGCLLGGFCLSMWLLTLQPGGLIPTVGGKVVFIAAFTLTAFGSYFTRWTQTYSLISCISFSGATVAVLGIDCFSRAGLREFWAYLWALNDNLFPLGASTYPLTRGIRVELAVTILIFLAGIVSQLKLWRIIKEHRDKRNAKIAEEERNLRVEEETVGQQVEETTSRARREWERVYGDVEGGLSPLGGSTDSGVSDMGSEKPMRDSNGALTVITIRPQSPTELDGENGLVEVVSEKSTLPSPPVPKTTAAERVISIDAVNGSVTVMVAQDPIPEEQASSADSSELDRGGEIREEAWDGSTQRRKSQPLTPLPAVVPLPFRIPEARENSDRSSVATFAETEDGRESRCVKSESMVRRLSTGSAKLLRRLSQRSTRSMQDGNEWTRGSREELVKRARNTRDDIDSLAADMDDMSSNGMTESANGDAGPSDTQVDPKSDIAEKQKKHAETLITMGETILTLEALATKTAAESTTSIIDTVSLSPVDGSEPDQLPASPDLAGREIEAEVVAEDRGTATTIPEDAASAREKTDKTNRRRDSATSVDSVTASLSKSLPPALSRVAMSYRTNEWAKHLSTADAPELETLQLHENPEEPAPLDVVELQQTAENATPPPAAPRVASALSSYGSMPHLVTRSSSRVSLSGYSDATVLHHQLASAPEPLTKNRSGPYRSVSGTLRGRGSRLFAEPIAEEGDDQPYYSMPPMAEDYDGPPTHAMHSSAATRELSTSASVPNLSMWLNGPNTAQQAPPQTLIGMRERLLRTKALGPFASPGADAAYGGMPTIPASGPPSDAGSLHNSVGGGSNAPIDADDIPLSQRRIMIRQSSLDFASRGRSSAMASSPRATTPNANSAMFDSHQPSRRSNATPEFVRQAQLASFRNSVAADLRAMPSNPNLGALSRQSSYGRETPLNSGLIGSASMGSLRGAYGLDADARRSIEVQRNTLLGQKDAEAVKREAERLEHERNQREFEERMRSGALMEAHRDAMRRLQGGVRDV
ncbi:hypothetical protein B0T26DRAFT_750443 [Lasiosphaeria miniovina]|uniref:TM7S3/TM198-like domain-containing protein n=1 Tax=Lasiosphaeria miniovina TaxID=1954250 RepID=A0AA40AWB5_9PEZI|nr:uncharacterized protein B0T26DRAFT_750443 [Lasiosphaeria miniovina]KAK0723134.1 hypothetical protein B0T26DRAFT_750443 [Lasiosphaeria miniovina]